MVDVRESSNVGVVVLLPLLLLLVVVEDMGMPRVHI
jgi:hypothetical protein